MRILDDINKDLYSIERKPLIGCFASFAIACEEIVKTVYHFALSIIYAVGGIFSSKYAERCIAHSYQTGHSIGNIFARLLNITTLGFLFYQKNPAFSCYVV